MHPLVTGLDHVLIHSTDLDRDAAHYATLLGRPARNAGTQGEAPCVVLDAGNVSVVLLQSDSPPGLAGLCFRTDDRSRLERRLARLGLDENQRCGSDPVGPATGGAPASVTWLDAHRTRSLNVGFVEREPARSPAIPGAVTGLDHAVIASAHAPGTGFLLGAQLGLDLRLDISRPEWNARLLFFRCGDLILEVFQRLDGEAATDRTSTSVGAAVGSDASQDAMYGLSWRVEDAPAARAELARQGVDVSDLRKGRKPGTRVFTVRNHTAGVATLMLEPGPITR